MFKNILLNNGDYFIFNCFNSENKSLKNIYYLLIENNIKFLSPKKFNLTEIQVGYSIEDLSKLEELGCITFLKPKAKILKINDICTIEVHNEVIKKIGLEKFLEKKSSEHNIEETLNQLNFPKGFLYP